MDKKARGRRTRTAVVNLDSPGRLVVLSTNPSDRTRLFNGAEAAYALSIDTAPYDIDNLWAAESRADLALVDVRDGSRRTLRMGAVGFPSPSPYGKYIAWFNTEDGN